MKTLNKCFAIVLIFILAFALMPVGTVSAADQCVNPGATGGCYATIQEAIDAASDGEMVTVYDGTYVPGSAITVNKNITLSGVDTPLIQVSGTGERIIMNTAGATLEGFHIEKTDKTGVQNIIYVGANNLTIQNNKIWGQFVIGDGEVSRAMVFTGGLSGLNITKNEIFNLRQPGYISGVTTGTISNNYVYRTKGWVIEQGDMTFTGNTWGTGADANVYDIAILNTASPAYYTDIPGMSAANNGASIEDQRTSPATLNPVYVDDSAPAGGTGTEASPLRTISEGFTRVSPGGTVYVADGTYNETSTININKAVSIIGPSGGTAAVVGAVGSNKVFEITASHVTIQNLSITLAAVSSNYDGLINLPDPAVSISDINILDNEIYVAPQSGAMSTWWAQAVHFGRFVINSTVSGNEMYNTRSGLVVGYNSAVTISDNVIYNTKGGIMNYTGSVADADARVISGNSWKGIHNEWDIVWNSGGGPYIMDMNKFVLQLSGLNNDAYVVSQMPPAYTTPAMLIYGNRSHMFVNAATGTTTIKNDNGNKNVPYAKIQDGINGVVPGGTVYVAGGTYTEQVVMNKSLTLLGSDDPVITPPASVVAYKYPESSKWWEPVVFAYGGTADAGHIISGTETINVTMTGFTVDGADRVPTSGYRSAGILLRNVDGLVSDNKVMKMLVGNAETFGIMAQGDSVITIDLNNISGYARGGIGANGDLSTGIDPVATITNNIVTGPGMGIPVTWAPNGIQIGWGATGTIQGNTVSGNGWPGSDWSGTGILIAGADGVQVLGNTVQDNESGIGVVGDVFFGTNDNATGNNIQGNIVSGNTYGVIIQGRSENTTITSNTITGSSYDGIDVFGTPAPTGTQIELNKLYGNNTEADPTSGNLWVASGVATVDASPNWWGSMYGPDPASIIGDAQYIKWCGDAACTFFLPNDGGVIELSGSIPGGIVIDQPNLTILLKNGTVITGAAGQSCIDINASYTTITTESIGGAKCVPGAGANGINVGSALVNVIIEGIEFTGPTAADGIHFAGSIRDILIVNNWFHNLGGDGVEFLTEPLGVVSIQGNLFQNNAGMGIKTPGLFNVPAEWNSWGHIDGAAAGDGASAMVDTDPWTHVDLYIPGGLLPSGGQVTVTVYGNFENVTGAEFTLSYPTDVFTLVGTPINKSAFVPAGPAMFDLTTAGKIRFNGTIALPALPGDPPVTPISGEDLAVYEATFNIVGGGTLDLLEVGDLFAMSPADAGPSNNIYAAGLVDSYVTANNWTVTGTVSMQGRSVRNGVPATLTGLNYGPYAATSINIISNNLVFSGVAEGNYTFTTLQPRYLNIPASMNKGVGVTNNRDLPPLVLKGGNAIWKDNIYSVNTIDLDDASKVGTEYGVGTINDDSDVNFDGKVNILDLTLVGGNFDLTSELAYAGWAP